MQIHHRPALHPLLTAAALSIPFVADPDNRLYPGLRALLNPEDQYVVGIGSGLGLSIVSEILIHRGGAIRFVKPIDPWKADLEMTLP